GVGRGVGGRGDLASLELAHELVDRDSAVDDVLAVVAGVVPTAGHVERVVAAGSATGRVLGRAAHRVVALVRRDSDVAGRPRVPGPAAVQDRDAVALRVVELERVLAHRGVFGCIDVKRMARLTIRAQREAGTAAAVATEVDGVHVLPGSGVDAPRGRG